MLIRKIILSNTLCFVCVLTSLVLIIYLVFLIIEDEDYIATVVNVTFPAGVTMVNITVPVIPDLVIEGTEIFYVQLDKLPDQPVTIVEQNTSLGIIIDDDTPCKKYS